VRDYNISPSHFQNSNEDSQEDMDTSSNLPTMTPSNDNQGNATNFSQHDTGHDSDNESHYSYNSAVSNCPFLRGTKNLTKMEITSQSKDRNFIEKTGRINL